MVSWYSPALLLLHSRLMLGRRSRWVAPHLLAQFSATQASYFDYSVDADGVARRQIIAGGGGGFLHPTHVDVTRDLHENVTAGSPPLTYEFKASYPDPRDVSQADACDSSVPALELVVRVAARARLPPDVAQD
jgi:hypothetical protein